MLKSELLEREAEARRIELAETFDELRARATPGHVLDQLVDYATESGGADFFRNLRDQTVANPLALSLVGAGLAWLMISSGRGPRRGYDPYALRSRGRMRRYFAGTRERAGEVVSGARQAVSDAATGVRDRVADAAQTASDAAGSVASTARSARDAAYGAVSSFSGQARSRAGDTTAALGQAASALYGSVADTAGRTASGLRAVATGTASTGRDMFDFARDQPLILAGLGLAFGAAVGAAFPSTRTERRLMGEASEDLRERTQAFAAENYERSKKSLAGAVYDEVQQRAREGGSPSVASPGIVPPDEETTDTRETTRAERIGLRDERS